MLQDAGCSKVKGAAALQCAAELQAIHVVDGSTAVEANTTPGGREAPPAAPVPLPHLWRPPPLQQQQQAAAAEEPEVTTYSTGEGAASRQSVCNQSTHAMLSYPPFSQHPAAPRPCPTHPQCCRCGCPPLAPQLRGRCWRWPGGAWAQAGCRWRGVPGTRHAPCTTKSRGQEGAAGVAPNSEGRALFRQ